MKKTIQYSDFTKRFVQAQEQEVKAFIVRKDGAVYAKGPYPSMISPEQACNMAYRHALAHELGADESCSRFAFSLLNYAGKSLICHRGLVYWPTPTVSLCSQGRWAREAYRAALLLKDTKSLSWLQKMFVAWPFDEENDRFVERFCAVTHYPTSVHGFLTAYNMVAEGAADAWLLANACADPALQEKAERVILKFILPGQRPDGFWSYHAKRSADLGLLNDGEEEYNYNLYLIYILSALLEFERGRALLQEPLKRSFDALFAAFGRSDGSMYAPVHWGWDHIFESTLLCAVICWRLYHWCGWKEYESVCARALHWLMTADLGVGNLAGGMSAVGLYWNTFFEDLLLERFCVTGDCADEESICQTLRTVAKNLSVPPADRAHNGLYFSLRVYETSHAIERRIMRLQREIEDSVQIPNGQQAAEIVLPWENEADGYSAIIKLRYDAQALYLNVQTNAQTICQPYNGAGLYQADGVLLEIRQNGAKPCRISICEENAKPVLFAYNPELPFGGDLRLYVKSEPHGTYLKNSSLKIEKTQQGICYCAKLLWAELGIAGETGTSFSGGISINRFTPYGVQYNEWGRTAMETGAVSYDGRMILA